MLVRGTTPTTGWKVWKKLSLHHKRYYPYLDKRKTSWSLLEYRIHRRNARLYQVIQKMPETDSHQHREHHPLLLRRWFRLNL